MSNPFTYPKSVHRRRLDPGPYKDYKRYKPHLREEFSKQCVYCRMPDGPKGHETFGVDHYRPKRRFRNLVTKYENLFYCCNPCNARKGDFWPSGAQRNAKQFVPNPCDHTMYQHLRYAGPRVEGKTAAGHFTVELLDLQAEEAELYREELLATIDGLTRRRDDVAKIEAHLQEMMRLGSTAPTLAADLARAQQEVQQLNDALTRWSGA